MGFREKAKRYSDEREFVCDAAADVAALPTDCDAGSVALVIETGDVYMLTTAGAWSKVGGDS